MLGRKYPEKITSQIIATICDTTLSNSIESHSEAPEEFTNHTTSQGTPLDFSYSSLDLENSSLDLENSSLDLENSRLDLTKSSLDLTQSPSHKATSAAQMQTNPVVPGGGRSVNPISTEGGILCPPHYNVPPSPSRFSDIPTAQNWNMGLLIFPRV